MATFSVGSFSSDDSSLIRGQAITANVAGPNGSGGPGSATQVTITNISIGFATSSTSGRSNKCYVYSIALGSVDDIGQATGLLAESTTGAYADGSGRFGTGTYYRQWPFASSAAFGVGGQVYIYFDRDQTARISSNKSYLGGDSYDDNMDDMDPDCLQFQVTFDTA